MSKEIHHYVENIQAILLNDLVTDNRLILDDIANYLIEVNKEDFHFICQAYEVVKHQLVG